jgi:O-antigen/teichoic acid export membrane protein
MGIVKKQAYKNTLVSYIGMVVGYFNVLLFVQYLSPNQYGLYQLLIGASILFSLLGSVGVPGMIVKYFPFFKTEDRRHNGFIYWITRYTLIGLLISSLIYILLKPTIISLYIKDSPLFVGYFYWLIPLACFTILYNLFEAFGKVIYQSVYSSFLKEVLLKVLTTLSLLTLAKGWITFHQFVALYISYNGIITILLFLSLVASKKFSFRFEKVSFQSVTGKEVINYGLFTLLSSSVYVLWQKVDVLMLSSMAGLAITGVYGFYTAIAIVINVPTAALSRTTYQIVADAWKTSDMKNIAEVYYKTSIIQMVFGCLLFMGIIINKDNLFVIISKKEYINHFDLFYIIGLSCLIDITGGLNTYIITTSPKYRLISIFVAVASVFCIALTYILIPMYGGIGAAVAYLITISGFNFCNWLYLKYRYDLQPFNFKHLFVILITICSYFLGKYFWHVPNVYLDIVLRSGIVAAFYGSLTYVLKISVDINEKIDNTWKKLNLFIK